MSNKVSRRDILKLGAGAAAGFAGASLSAVSPARARARQSVTEISYWQPPIWRYGADNETVTGAGSDEWLRDAISRFEAIHPDIKVNLEFIPWEQWGAKLSTSSASGEVPNVLYGVVPYNIGLIESELLIPIEDYMDTTLMSNWVSGVQTNMTVNGRVYGVPAFLNPDVTSFSKTALEKHGGAGILEAVGENRGNLTFDMLEEYGREFSDGSSRYFLGFPTDHGSVAYWMFGNWLASWGVQAWDDNHERWIAHENDNAVRAFDWILSAQNDWGILIPNLPKWSDVDNFYWGENCAARYQWPAVQTELEVAQEAGQASADFEVFITGQARLPEVEPFLAGSTPIGYLIGKGATSAQDEAAVTFANWLGTDDSNAAGWLVNGFFPATLSGLQAVGNHAILQDPNKRWVLDTYLSDFAPEPYPAWNWRPMRNPVADRLFTQLNPIDMYIQQFQSLLLGQKSSAQMLQEIAERINGALGVDI